MTLIKSYIITMIKKSIILAIALNLSKLVLILITSILIINNSKKVVFKKIFYIFYLVQFYNNKI